MITSLASAGKWMVSVAVNADAFQSDAATGTLPARAEIRAGRVIAYRAPVVGNKAERRLLRGVVRHLLVVRIGEGIGVDPREVGDIEKAFDLAAGKSLHLEGRAVDLLKAGVVPVRHGR